MKISEIQVSYLPTIKPSERTAIKSSLDAYNLLKSQFPEHQIYYKEVFMVLYLDKANKVLGVHKHSSGTDAATIVSIKQVLAIGLKVNASGIILAHNHPSGNLSPSSQDIQLTSQMKVAAKLFDIQVLDHLIINAGYYSMADEGML